MAKGFSLRGALTKDMGTAGKVAPAAKMVAKPQALAPIPAKWAGLPENVARSMMLGEKLNPPAAAKKALAAGTVTGKGDIQRSTRTPGTRGGPGYIGVGGKK